MASVHPVVAEALTDPEAYRRASREVRTEAISHIYEAVMMVWDAPNKEARQAMLARLPSHIADMAREYIAAHWGMDVLFVTDNSESGFYECQQEAAQRGGIARRLPLMGLSVAVRKKEP